MNMEWNYHLRHINTNCYKKFNCNINLANKILQLINNNCCLILLESQHNF